MRRKKERFLEILRMELEDLVLDLRDRIDMYVQGNAAGEITNYVMTENTAVLENEIAGIRHLIEYLDRFEIDDAEDLSDMVERVLGRCRRNIEELHLPGVLCDMLKRKCAKVERYVAG